MVRYLQLILALWLGTAAQGAQLYVGTAETSITPDRPVALEGFFELRISDGVHSPITANVVVLESREDEQVVERSIMVSADLVHLPMALIEGVRARVVKRRPDIDPGKIFISATHTHQAPVVMPDNFILPEGVMTVAEYNAFFIRQVSDAILTACETLHAGSVAWGLGHAHTAYNRRIRYLNGRARMSGPSDEANFKGPEGPEYQGIPMLFLFNREGTPLAAAINVWSPSQEGRVDRNLISADFWHPVRERLKTHFGKNFTVLAFCGPAGDQMTTRRIHAEAEDRMRRLRGLDWLDEFGRRIAESVIETHGLVKSERHSAPVLKHRSGLIQLPGWKLSEDQLTNIREHRDVYAKELAAHPERANRLARPISWRSQTLERQAKIAANQGFYPSEIHVLRIGEVALCTNPFELFTEYGLRMVARSGEHLTMAVQLTGPAHYLPTAEAIQGGSYSAIPESCAVGAEGGAALVDQTVHWIHELFNDFEITLPETGQLVDGKPAGKDWVNLLGDFSDWNAEPEYWKLSQGVLRGASSGGKYHYASTKKTYQDFELHAVVRMQGRGANSGVCIRLQPGDPNKGPGYQVDMGPGYWGCLWEEGGEGMVQAYPPRLAKRLVQDKDWNHYYIRAKGHRIQAWLNGVQTIDVVHKSGFPSGAIGFELCHGDKHTELEVRTLVVRPQD